MSEKLVLESVMIISCGQSMITALFHQWQYSITEYSCKVTVVYNIQFLMRYRNP